MYLPSRTSHTTWPSSRPDTQDSRPSAVPDAVGRQLADGACDVLEPLARQREPRCVPDGEGASLAQPKPRLRDGNGHRFPGGEAVEDERHGGGHVGHTQSRSVSPTTLVGTV